MTDHAHNFRDITGQTFGRVEVLDFVGRNLRNEALWLCRCDCGREFVTSGHHLRGGRVKRCNACRLKLQPLRARLLNSGVKLRRKKRR